MTGWIPDATLEHLREAMLWPDLSATRYRAREVIDRGGMGIVFLADDLELEREVALEVLDGADLTDEHRARMVREARILASLEHPGLVPVYEVGALPDGRVYYAMQRIRGERLDQAMLRPQPLPDRVRLLVRICETVAYAHARGESEQIGPWSDVCALGAVLEFLLTPEGTDVPRPLAAIAARARADHPSDRYRGAAELAFEFSRYLDRLPVAAYRENLLERTALLSAPEVASQIAGL